MEELLKKHSDKIRFVIVGGVNTAIDMAILFSLVNIVGLSIFFSNIISTSVALCFSFYANKTFTFKDNNQNLKTKIIVFLSITLFGLWVMQPIIIAITKSIFGHLSVADNVILMIGKLAATCVTLVWNYLMYRKFVFKKDQETKKQFEQ